jgi:hypothetical protein
MPKKNSHKDNKNIVISMRITQKENEILDRLVHQETKSAYIRRMLFSIPELGKLLRGVSKEQKKGEGK